MLLCVKQSPFSLLPNPDTSLCIICLGNLVSESCMQWDNINKQASLWTEMSFWSLEKSLGKAEALPPLDAGISKQPQALRNFLLDMVLSSFTVVKIVIL